MGGSGPTGGESLKFQTSNILVGSKLCPCIYLLSIREEARGREGTNKLAMTIINKRTAMHIYNVEAGIFVVPVRCRK